MAIIATFTANDVDHIDVSDIDDLVNGSSDKMIKFELYPSSQDAALVAFTSCDGVSFADGNDDYSYSAVAFDNEGAQVYGSNDDNRAHITPSFNSNLVGYNGISGRMFITNPNDDAKYTRVHGFGSYCEPDNDTNAFKFAFARNNAEILKVLRLRFRKRSDGSFINFSGTVKIYED